VSDIYSIAIPTPYLFDGRRRAPLLVIAVINTFLRDMGKKANAAFIDERA
jgi:hypothetical protein